MAPAETLIVESRSGIPMRGTGEPHAVSGIRIESRDPWPHSTRLAQELVPQFEFDLSLDAIFG